VIDLYGIPDIPPDEHSMIFDHFLHVHLQTTIKPQLLAMGINFYIVPLTLSDNNMYMIPYKLDYMREYYDGYQDTPHIIVTVYLLRRGLADDEHVEGTDEELEEGFVVDINMDRPMTITYDLDNHDTQMVCDLLQREFPYNYTWCGNTCKAMQIEYVPHEGLPPIQATPAKYYPKLYMTMDVDTPTLDLIQVDGFLHAHQFTQDLETMAYHVEYEYSCDNLEITFYGVESPEVLRQYIKGIVDGGELTFSNDTDERIDIMRITRNTYFYYVDIDAEERDEYFGIDHSF